MSQAANKAPGFQKHPEHRVDLEPAAERVRIEFGGEVLADSDDVVVVRESRYPPVYYLPLKDVRQDFLKRTDHHTYCPFKGEASYYTVTAGDKTAQNAVWTYEAPYDECADLKDRVAFYWDKMDAWYADGEKIAAPKA